MSDYAPDQSTAREDLCRFLSACYYEPAEEFAEEKLFDSILVAASRLDPELASHARKLGEAFSAQDLQTLLVDYTRLFLGPMEMLAKPYGSSWLKASAATETNPLPAVMAFYDEGGFEIDPAFMELPDHVAVELEFLYLLNFNQHQALNAGKLEDLKSTESLKKRFLTEHIGAWITPFSASISAHAQTEFYRELALLTERFVLMEKLAADPPRVH